MGCALGFRWSLVAVMVYVGTMLQWEVKLPARFEKYVVL